MEQVFVVARQSFVNSRIGSVTRRQRFPLSVGVARELASMGLVDIEKQPMTVQDEALRDPLGAGPVAPSSLLPADQVSVTSNSKRRGRGKRSGGAV